MEETLYWWQCLKVHRPEGKAVLNKYHVLGCDRNHAQRILEETELHKAEQRTFGLHKCGTFDDYMDVFGEDGADDLDLDNWY